MTTGLVLGSVQWGIPYGIANTVGMPSDADLDRLLAVGRAGGVTSIDTARAYGRAEERIGQLAGAGWRVLTKLADDVDRADDPVAAARASVDASRNALQRPALDALLLHRGHHRQLAGGDVWRLLLDEQAAGRIARLGISAATPEEALAALDDGEVEVVQVATSLLDRRLSDQDFFRRAAARDLEVHVRSVFLQGVAFLPVDGLPAGLGRLGPALDIVDEWCDARRLTRPQAFLGHALGLGAAGVVVGCERPAQLEQLLAWASTDQVEGLAELADRVGVDDADLVDPSRWEGSQRTGR